MKITKHVQAAVAYVSTTTNPIIADCDRLGIRCQVWSRHDETLPTALRVMEWACKRMKANGNLTWKLLGSYYHPKVIWWRGYGVYIGSANLTDAAWNSNCEAGIVILESEIDSGDHRQQFEDFFTELSAQAVTLTDAIYAEAERLAQYEADIDAIRQKMNLEFQASEAGKQLARKSLSDVKKRSSGEVKKADFLREWGNTLDHLKFIQDRLATNRPEWVPVDVSPGIHTDQFLHAYYYTQVREGQNYPVEDRHKTNCADPVNALNSAINWWRSTTQAPSSEDMVFRDWAPTHRELLTSERLARMTEAEFVRVARRIHSTNNFAKRQRREDVFDDDELANDPDTERKRDAFCEQLYYRRNLLGWQPPQAILYLLFGGTVEEVPTRLFDCLHPPYKIAGLDLSSLGELIGCGLPNDYPPRNDRTNKALRALGWDVIVRSPTRD